MMDDVRKAQEAWTAVDDQSRRLVSRICSLIASEKLLQMFESDPLGKEDQFLKSRTFVRILRKAGISLSASEQSIMGSICDEKGTDHFHFRRLTELMEVCEKNSATATKDGDSNQRKIVRIPIQEAMAHGDQLPCLLKKPRPS